MKKFFKIVFLFTLITSLVAIAAGLVVGLFFYFRLTRDLPKLEKISDYQPKAVTSIYADDGTLIAEHYDERRYPIDFKDIPLRVRHAFLAAEDASFYTHPGIDLISIARAAWVNFRKKSLAQGASTITQQMVRSLVLSKERSWERKVKEAILAYRIEKALTKDEIFSIYLNEIYLGSHAYGVNSAAKVHFHKELADLTLGEAAFLAGLPTKPSYWVKLEHREEAFRQQQRVLERMLENGMISTAEMEAALAEKLVIYPPDNQKIFRAPYYVTHVMSLLDELEQQQKKRIFTNPGGYKVYTTADLRANDLAERAVQRGVREIDKRRGYRGPLLRLTRAKVDELLATTNKAFVAKLVSDDKKNALVRAYWAACHVATDLNACPRERSALHEGEIYRALITGKRGPVLDVTVGENTGTVNLKTATWANKLLGKEDRGVGIEISRYLEPGMVVEVSLTAETPAGELVFDLDQTPELEGAFILQNALTGAVKAIVGGYDYQRSEFNRATQGLRQPGSAFKPFIYLASIDSLKYTPSTIVPDTPVSLVAGNGELWTPGNFDHKFLGPITLRTALQRSRNVVSVHLIQRLGIDRAIESARKLGITTPIGRDLSISLGTAEVKLIELVRAYSVFAAAGYLSESLVITSIEDRNGNVVYKKGPIQKPVIDEDTAFLMANMMKGVIENGTAQVLKKLNRPVAGKTGTTNEHMDAWFIGYTPEWAAGVWVGFDVKRMIGRLETGGKAAAPIFLHFMEEFLKDTPVLDFDIPDGVVPVFVNRNSGRPTDPEDPAGFFEYFKIGTEPSPYTGAYDEGGEFGEPGLPPARESRGARDYLEGEDF